MRDPLVALAAGLLLFGSINAVWWVIMDRITREG